MSKILFMSFPFCLSRYHEPVEFAKQFAIKYNLFASKSTKFNWQKRYDHFICEMRRRRKKEEIEFGYKIKKSEESEPFASSERFTTLGANTHLPTQSVPSESQTCMGTR